MEKVTHNEIIKVMQKKKSEKATGPSEVSVETIVASCKIGVELCQHVL